VVQAWLLAALLLVGSQEAFRVTGKYAGNGFVGGRQELFPDGAHGCGGLRGRWIFAPESFAVIVLYTESHGDLCSFLFGI
jgi:hypothetical protein